MNFVEAYTRIRRATKEDFEPIRKAAEMDGHASMFPTHVVEKNNQIVGFISIGKFPVVFLWMDTKMTKVRDSIAAVNFTEDVLREHNVPVYCMPCMANSPYYPFVEKAGFSKLGLADLLIKKV